MTRDKRPRLSLTDEWILKAQSDLESAEILFREAGPPDSICFHCHQSVEKFLKAYLTAEKMRFEKVHNLWSLSKLLKKDKKLLSFEEKLKLLDAYYIESRYPPDIKSYSREECAEVLKIAREITQFVFSRIEA